jgi:pimeloyl-ACP methyl ester carboxylesterase
VKLFFRKEGEGEPFVILHGLYGSSDNWRAISRQLAGKYTVYTPDLRNHGHSPHHHEHTYHAMRDDLNEFLDDQGIRKTILMGHSMGGKLGMYFAADYPEKVSKLIVADIAPKNYLLEGDESQYQLHRNIFQAMLGAGISRLKTRREVDDRLAEIIDSQAIRQFLLKNVTTDKATRSLMWRLNVDVLYDHLDEIVGGVNERWFSDRIPLTSCPVVFIRGLQSSYITGNDIHLIKRMYPDACIIDIPGAGHWLHSEQPGLFLEALRVHC